MNKSPESQNQRREAVSQERGSAALEGIQQTPLMKELTDKYVTGDLTIGQAIKKAREHYGYEP
ncbi:antitoxin VbhA family protein [Pseudomonas putida]|uniref:Antitoxin VbhA family protein n=1 Tax=Pseudomonas putida TaxID=303 RepID=A0A8I1EAU0_PSEPU|nr:antitoxin VbhA family protein [Pseudomonas putida]MBI6882335.1 antitoxin VbhA family protein [Pseudomonas putida]